MGVHNGGDVLFPGQFFNQIEDYQLILEVQVGLRLVKHQHLRIYREGAGNENHLKLAPAHLGQSLSLSQVIPHLTVSEVWTIADITNGLMAIPNCISLIVLSGVIVKVTDDYFEKFPNFSRKSG